MEIRDAGTGDLEAIVALYNHYLDTTTAAWSERHQTLAERQAWFAAQQADGYPVLVAVDHPTTSTASTEPTEPTEPTGSGDGGQPGSGLVGYASYGRFRGAGMWPGYGHTAEHTIYVHPGRAGRGVGARLLSALEDRARATGIHVLVGGIDADNVGSIRFHEHHGFREVARMPEVGRKWGRWLDLVLVQKILDPPEPPDSLDPRDLEAPAPSGGADQPV